MRKFCKERSLAYLNPNLAEEWDYEKNGLLRPENVREYSGKKVGWICKKCGYRWIMSPKDRYQNHYYCRGCNLLAIKNPKLAKEWHPTKNGTLTAYDISYGNDKRVWWKCKDGHEWQAKVCDRNTGNNCPYCSGHRVCPDNCLAVNNPKLASEWHPTKNGKLTPHDVTRTNSRKVWWLCENKHEWLATVHGRAFGNNCPYCSKTKRRVCIDNCLATKNPELAKEWSIVKNGNLTPYGISCSNSSKKVWWQCKNGHTWLTSIWKRKSGRGCPFCKKIELKDGTVWDSLAEASYYLELKRQKIRFRHHIGIGLGRCVCDFYIPSINKYIEVTGYNCHWPYWKKYYRKILKKKSHVIRNLGAKFEFIRFQLTTEQVKYIRANSK